MSEAQSASIVLVLVLDIAFYFSATNPGLFDPSYRLSHLCEHRHDSVQTLLARVYFFGCLRIAFHQNVKNRGTLES